MCAAQSGNVAFEMQPTFAALANKSKRKFSVLDRRAVQQFLSNYNLKNAKCLRSIKSELTKAMDFSSGMQMFGNFSHADTLPADSR